MSTASDDSIFILGAGFSKAISPEMPTLKELGDRLSTGLPAGLANDPSMLGGDVELWLSYLAQKHSWLKESDQLRNQALFLDLSAAVAQVIHESVCATSMRPWPNWLMDLCDYWGRSKSTVVTLNYDTLLEVAGQRPTAKSSPRYTSGLTDMRQRTGAAIIPPDESLEAYTLIKLHGSVNWFYSGIERRSSDAVYADHAKEQLRQWGLTRHEGLVPMIVPPLADKSRSFQNATTRQQWVAAAAALRKARRIYVLGYSMPATDSMVRFLFTEARDKEIFVVDSSDAVKMDFRDRLGPRFSFNFDFAGLREAIPRFVTSLIGRV